MMYPLVIANVIVGLINAPVRYGLTIVNYNDNGVVYYYDNGKRPESDKEYQDRLMAHIDPEQVIELPTLSSDQRIRLSFSTEFQYTRAIVANDPACEVDIYDNGFWSGVRLVFTDACLQSDWDIDADPI
jgi:hypothetical protein